MSVRVAFAEDALRRGVLSVLLVLLVASTGTAAERHVLLLQSFDHDNPRLYPFSEGFRADLERLVGEPVTFTQVVVQPSGFTPSPESAILAFLRLAYVERPTPDLVVTFGGPAAAFARKYRQQIFPSSPMLFAAVEQRWLLQGPALAENEAAVPVVADFPRMIDDLLHVFPQTSNVFIVLGSGPFGKFWRPELEAELDRFRNRVAFTWSGPMSLGEILKHVSILPPRSAIFYIAFDVDQEGRQSLEASVFSQIHAVANAPIFGLQGAALGRGIVGGRTTSGSDVARVTAGAALRILNGESPRAIRIPPLSMGSATFDWRELRRWDISESRLPPGSTILFREPGVWERSKGVIIATSIALIAEGLLIGVLLASRKRRQRAEQSLRENVIALEAARGALSNLSGRLMQAQEEERTRLARELHDDVTHRMSFIAIDLASLREKLPATASELRDDVEGLADAVTQLAREVQGISHRLHSPKLEYVGLPAAAATFCDEISSRHHAKIEFVHGHVPSDLAESVAVTLFRVLQEAVSNAVKHSGCRHCRVTLSGADEAMRLEVVDNGRGFDRDAALRKRGLGLISMQERLKLVGGEILIKSTPGVGTTVRARVPMRRRAVALDRPTPQPVSSPS